MERCRAARLVVVAALSLSAPLLALDPKKAITQYVHEEWHVKDGLPQDGAFSIVQSRDGYVWFGTESGLVRFDGVRFTVFDRRSAPALTRDSVGVRQGSLLPGRDGSLWISNGRLTRLQDGAFTELGKADGLTSETINVLFEDRAGVLWIGTAGGGLNRLKDGRFSGLTTKEGLPHDRVRAIAEDREGSLWIGTVGGLGRLKGGTLTSWAAKDGLADDVVNAIVEDRDGSLWIGTGGGLSRMRDGRFATYTTKDGLPGDVIVCLREDRDGILWIGGPAGLARLTDGKIESFDPGLSEGDAVISLLEDREGSLWFGTSLNGLHRLRDGKFTPYTVKEGLSDSFVNALLESREGSIWFGTESGLDRLKDGRITHLGKPDGLSADGVNALLESRDGSLWVGTSGGLNRLKDGRISRWTSSDGLSNDVVSSLLEDREGSLWIGTNRGLNWLKAGRLSAFTAKDGLSGNSISSLVLDRDGTLWIGTFRGLNSLRDGTFTAFTTKEGLPHDRITLAGLLEDRDGTLWIGTAGGLARIRDGKLESLVMPEGPFDDNLYRLLEDDRGDLWTASNKGVFRIDRRGLEAWRTGNGTNVPWTRFDADDGLPIAEGTCCGRLKTRDGRLWFPTTRGVAVVDPARIPTNTVPPPVVVEEVLADGRLVPGSAAAARLELAPGAGKLEIRYTATSLVVPKRVRFRYRLEGFDPDWVEAGTDRVAHYTNLPTRAYTFRVTACNDDGLWNETGASLPVTLLPRFWQTRWFQVLEVLAGLGVLAGALVAQRGRRRAQRDRDLAAERRAADLERKTGELEQARRLQLGLLPSEALSLGEYTVAGRMETATEVGGDWFGYVEAAGRLCVVIGDATGHGLASGLVAGMLKSALAALSRTEVSALGPARWLNDLNGALKASISRRGLGVCAGIALVNVETGEVELGMAGVPHPFLVSPVGTVERLPMSGTPLGYLRRILVATAIRVLEPGARLVLVTDGFVEQTNGADEEWGYAGVEAALAATARSTAGPEELAEGLLAACERHGAGQARTDDRTVVVLARKAGR